jgi:hypothetical protein
MSPVRIVLSYYIDEGSRRSGGEVDFETSPDLILGGDLGQASGHLKVNDVHSPYYRKPG